MKLALVQLNTIVGDLEGNTKKIIDSINATKGKADLIIFPELVITGYPPQDLLFRNDFIEKNQICLKEIAKHCVNISTIVGFVDSKDNSLFNAAAFIKDNIIQVQHKTLLPTYDVFDEKRYFKKADNYNVFKLKGKKIGIEICEDLWVEKDIAITGELVKKGADIIITISASPFHINKLDERIKLLQTRAVKNKVPIIYLNMVGGQDDLIFDGESLAVNKDGKLITQLKKFQEDLFILDLENSKIIEKKENPVIKDIHDALVLGVKDYTLKSGFKKAIISLSGGIDSAVTAGIAVRALGKDNVLGISLPSPHSSDHSIKDAEQLAENLGIELKKIPIKDIFNIYKSELNFNLPEDTTEENLQARIRGNILMAFSNKLNLLPLTTGNKSEIAVGYCTLYGDMSGGYAVLSDVYKMQVYGLAKFINKEKEIIPSNTIEKPPSAELKPNQLDQDTLPEYEILDEILKYYIEQNKSVKEIIKLGFKPEVVNKVIKMVDRNEYKRRQLAPGPKISKKAFGTGRKMPIVNKFS